MKKLLFALTLLVAISLLMSAALFAQPRDSITCLPNATGCALTVNGVVVAQFNKPEKDSMPKGSGATIFMEPNKPDSMRWDSLNMDNAQGGAVTLNPAFQSTGSIDPPLSASNLQGNRLAAASTNVLRFFFVISNPNLGSPPGEPLHNTTPLIMSGQIDQVPPGFGTSYTLTNPGAVTLFDGGGNPEGTVTAASVSVGGPKVPSLTTYGFIILALLLIATALWLFGRKRAVAKGGLA